jgi:hypothetical protein
MYKMANVNLQRVQFTVRGMHINRQGKDLTTRYLASIINSIFTEHLCDSPIFLNRREDHHDGNVKALGLVERSICNSDSDSDLNAAEEQEKCPNNLVKDPESGIVQNIISDIMQSVNSAPVQCSDQESSDMENVVGDVTQCAYTVKSQDYGSSDIEYLSSGQSHANDNTKLHLAHPTNESAHIRLWLNIIKNDVIYVSL